MVRKGEAMGRTAREGRKETSAATDLFVGEDLGERERREIGLAPIVTVSCDHVDIG